MILRILKMFLEILKIFYKITVKYILGLLKKLIDK